MASSEPLLDIWPVYDATIWSEWSDLFRDRSKS